MTPPLRIALSAALYSERHRLARRELAHRGGQLTLVVTTLLHEAYIRISWPTSRAR